MKPFEQWFAESTPAAPPYDPDLDQPMEFKCRGCECWFWSELTAREFDALPQHKQEGAEWCGGAPWCLP